MCPSANAVYRLASGAKREKPKTEAGLEIEGGYLPHGGDSIKSGADGRIFLAGVKVYMGENVGRMINFIFGLGCGGCDCN